MKYTIKERVFLVKKFYKYSDMKSKILREMRTEYPKQPTPNHSTVKDNVSNFEKYGSVAHILPEHTKPSPKREKAKIELKNLLTEFPQLSNAKAASNVGISPTLTYHIIHDDFHLKLYKFHRWHKLEDKDCPKRVSFADWFLSLPQSHHKYMFFSDEAYFYLTLTLNKQNNQE